jgi:hypothetical protein
LAVGGETSGIPDYGAGANPPSRAARKVCKRTLELQKIQKHEKADRTPPKNSKTWNGGTYNWKKSKNDGEAF